MNRPLTLPLATGMAFWLATAAAYAESPNCSLQTNCGLNRALHLLYAMATVLTVILVIVIAAAIYLYRKNKRSNLLP